MIFGLVIVRFRMIRRENSTNVECVADRTWIPPETTTINLLNSNGFDDVNETRKKRFYHDSEASIPKRPKVNNHNEYRDSSTAVPLLPGPVSASGYRKLSNAGGLFDITFEGNYDYEGGVLCHKHSDVQIVIPRGAIPVGISQKVAVRVSLLFAQFNIDLTADQLPMSPVIECLSPGLDRFMKPVIVKVPHRAQLKDSDWVFRVHHSQSIAGKNMTWNELDQSSTKVDNNIVQDITFNVDEKYVNISTAHFTIFTCTACGKNRRLNLEAVAFGQYSFFRRQTVAIKLYICDTIKDYKRRLKENEGQNHRSEYNTLKIISSDAPWVITSLGDTTLPVGKWEWILNDNNGHLPNQQQLEMTDIIRCCSDSVAPFCRFEYEPVNAEKQSHIRAAFSVKQAMEDSDNRGHGSFVVIEFELREQTPSKKHKIGSYTDNDVCSDNVLQMIANSLKPMEIRNLYRHLLQNEENLEVTITTIEGDHRNYGNEEIKYQLLLRWKERRGQDATLTTMVDGLTNCGHCAVADKLKDMDVV
ncbi:uncharacterized protein LOC144448434 [Glandiceps talaboti]